MKYIDYQKPILSMKNDSSFFLVSIFAALILATAEVEGCNINPHGFLSRVDSRLAIWVCLGPGAGVNTGIADSYQANRSSAKQVAKCVTMKLMKNMTSLAEYASFCWLYQFLFFDKCWVSSPLQKPFVYRVSKQRCYRSRWVSPAAPTARASTRSKRASDTTSPRSQMGYKWCSVDCVDPIYGVNMGLWALYVVVFECFVSFFSFAGRVLNISL